MFDETTAYRLRYRDDTLLTEENRKPFLVAMARVKRKFPGVTDTEKRFQLVWQEMREVQQFFQDIFDAIRADEEMRRDQDRRKENIRRQNERFGRVDKNTAAP